MKAILKTLKRLVFQLYNERELSSFPNKDTEYRCSRSNKLSENIILCETSTDEWIQRVETIAVRRGTGS